MKNLLFILIFLTHSVFLYADTIYLKNGRVIEGEIVKETDETVTIKQSFGKYGSSTSKYKKSDIERIEKKEKVEKDKSIAKEKPKQKRPRQARVKEESYGYKGVWMPAPGPVFVDLDKAAEAGINTLAFQMCYLVNDQGELRPVPGEKEFAISFIDKAHARGFKIWLNPEIICEAVFDKGGSPSEMRMMPEELLENTDLITNFKLAIIEMAKFAEEHDIEIFSPSSEMYVNIGRERSKTLLAAIKPKIDAVYTGKICLRGEWPIPELSAYSCFGPTVGIPKNEQEKNDLINQIENAKEQTTELMLGELWEGNDWQGSQEDAKRGFVMALEAARGKVSGVFILDLPRPTQLFPESYESTIKEFYTQNLIGLGVGGFFVPGQERVKKESYVYKGAWMPGIPKGWLASNMQKLKDVGMNTVSLAIMIIQEEGNPLVGLDTSHILDDIQLAHENGMKVMLTPQIYPKPRPGLEEKHLEKLNTLIIKAAELAEEYDVELFAPLCEPNTLISVDVKKWGQEILPKVKKVYHGEIYWSSPGVGSPDKATIARIAKQPPLEFAGYDYIGLTTLFMVSERLEPDEKIRNADKLTLEGYSRHVEGAIDYMLATSKRDGCKGIIIDEFGVMNRFFVKGAGVGDVLEEGWMSEEELARAIEIVFEKGKDKAVGFMVANFFEGEAPGMPGVYVKGISDVEKEVIKRWFRKILD